MLLSTSLILASAFGEMRIGSVINSSSPFFLKEMVPVPSSPCWIFTCETMNSGCENSYSNAGSSACRDTFPAAEGDGFAEVEEPSGRSFRLGGAAGPSTFAETGGVFFAAGRRLRVCPSASYDNASSTRAAQAKFFSILSIETYQLRAYRTEQDDTDRFDVQSAKRVCRAGQAADQSNLTETIFETPGSCIVTP